MRITTIALSLLLAVGSLSLATESRADVSVGISVRFGPPVLPVYVQPVCPGPGFIWIPGYWAYGPDGYFWVPGTWVEPPEVGLLWTPGFWAFEDGFYVWQPGYWGPEVGFYGGIDYGFGYPGTGFFGGYWRGRDYYYNRAVTNVNVTVVHNVYSTTVVNNTVNRVSFNGGNGGINARPTPQQINAERGRRVQMTAEQTQHQQAASENRTLLASVNHGRPDVTATERPSAFNNRRNVSPAHMEPTPTPGANRTRDNRMNTRPTVNSNPPSNSTIVNPGLNTRQQQEMDKLRQRQDAERQNMQQKQAREQQRLDQQNVNQQRQQELQRRHQQQMDEMNRRQDQQTQRLQERQQRDTQKQEQREQKQRGNEAGSNRHE